MKGIIIGVLAIICFYLLASTKKTPKRLIWIAYSAIFVVTISFFIYKIIYTSLHPEFWDFTCFYLYGKVASQGNNFYLPENMHAVFDSLNLPAILNIPSEIRTGFIDKCVNVGFPYPPPTILYFAPLGYLNYQTALIVWTSFISIFSFASIYLIYSMFLKEYKINGLILVSILFFVFSESKSTIFYTQTNFILLFLLLLMKKYSDNKIAGIFLALAFFTKPFMLIFILYFIIRKRWSSILYFIISSAALIGVTLAFFGKAPFMTYIFNNPASRFPKDVFFEGINQSLHSVLLRSNLITLDYPVPFMLISLLLFILTGFFILYLSKKKLFDNIWAVLLLIGLIIYPGTLSHYAVLLFFVIFQFFSKRSSLAFDPVFSTLIISIFYLLNFYSFFLAICFLIVLVIYKSLSPDFLNKENLHTLQKINV